MGSKNIVWSKICEDFFSLWDPFFVDPPPRPFYYPTAQRTLTAKERKTVLSPERPRRPGEDEDSVKIGDTTGQFLDGGNVYHHVLEEQYSGERSSKFNESWPSSERPSTLSDQSSPMTKWWNAELGLHPEPQRVKESISEYRPAEMITRPAGQPDSVLSKYIERFRYGTPRSRQDREKTESSKQDEFWWLKTSNKGGDVPSPISVASSSLTPTSSSTPKDEKYPSVSPQASPKFKAREVPRSPQKRYTKEDILTEKLQDRAARLLAMTDGSSTPQVSSVGVGSLSETPSTFEEEPYRPAFIKFLGTLALSGNFPGALLVALLSALSSINLPIGSSPSIDKTYSVTMDMETIVTAAYS